MLQSPLIASAIVALLYLGSAAFVTVLFAIRHGGRREDSVEDHESIAASRFTIPVSVIVPLADSVPVSTLPSPDFVAALLSLHYPEFEVIVVVDERHPWLDRLKAEWDLEAHEFFYRKSLATADVRRIYRSPRDARLLVIEKQPGGRADAVNCGVNVARFRYVTSIDPRIRFDAEALLRAMTGALRDPAAAIGASSRLERGGDSRVLRLATIRSLMLSNMAMARSIAAPAAPDAVIVWRRDAILQLGGFSPTAADADFDMTVRVEGSSKLGGEVVQTAEIFGQLESTGEERLTSLVARRQLAALQAVRSLAGAGAVGRNRLRAVLVSDVITPLAEVGAVGATAAAALGGWLPWRDVVLVFVLLSFGRAVISSAALLMRGAAAASPDRASLTGLLLFAPLELFVTAPAAVVGRARGVWSFVQRT